MYSEDSKQQIQKIERENFRKLKKQENKKRIIFFIFGNNYL